VIYRCEGDPRPNLVIEILEHYTIKVLGVIDCNLLRNPVTADDVLLEKFLDGCVAYISHGLRFNPLGKVLNRDDGEGVIASCRCEFADDIDAPALQGPQWSYQLRRLRGGSGMM
jgi:hypothetical protein